MCTENGRGIVHRGRFWPWYMCTEAPRYRGRFRPLLHMLPMTVIRVKLYTKLDLNLYVFFLGGQKARKPPERINKGY